MPFVHSVLDAIGGNGAKAYQCSTCHRLITQSDRLLCIGGTYRHLFVNPAGAQCDFYTFSSCPGAAAAGEATEAHTWFAGYCWRLAFCRQCGQHLGWHYSAVSGSRRPGHFWGILVFHLTSG
ncbi:MAG: cereblon family protein [Syntrophobacteria bacterium]